MTPGYGSCDLNYLSDQIIGYFHTCKAGTKYQTFNKNLYASSENM